MSTALLTPVFVYVAFCFVIIGMMGAMRFKAMSSGAVRGRQLKLGERNWPEKIQRVSNVAQNQWETPILFWGAIATALILELDAPLLVPLAWFFVVTRLVHATIYISVNHILSRFTSFALGLVAMAAMWIVIALEVFSQ
ncbi:MAG: MAPEG family protein [Maricaulis sp.]|uniref:MAPEG family protein n=1 Tax=Maricaulis sp. TaxID=1486257 RepID=UPI001B172A75|nr:MAPEG family protein [Maricaulis sp.]MBO6730095.1 MAPEG family protein [Maricaulis sp.]MBO6847691.1 MAPEG family protein [Maricaulis sp.]MBO6878490.1 MAPEG family protein [Maricaulis sp.]